MSELFKIYIAIKTFIFGKKGLEEGFSFNWEFLLILIALGVIIVPISHWYSEKKAKKQREKWNLKK